MPSVSRVAVLMPVFNDWKAASLLCQQLDGACIELPEQRVAIYLVDDGSTTTATEPLFTWPLRALEAIRVIRLRRNVGHQRAITLGLAYLYDQTDSTATLVMDADGQDKAADAVTLIQRHSADSSHVIFAARRKRFEGWLYTLAYRLYRLCHWLLTGIEVRIGNFSIVPRNFAGAIAATSEAWSHYAASVVKARIPMVTVPMDRGERLAGKSTMNYVSLVTHGLSAISVFRELVGTRLLLASVASATLVGLVLITILAGTAAGVISFDRQTAILTMLILLIALQALAASFALAFSILSGREQSSFLPIRDYGYYLDIVLTLNEKR
jgi:polyisoprenyl-phosphate glycosyltransferase